MTMGGRTTWMTSPTRAVDSHRAARTVSGEGRGRRRQRRPTNKMVRLESQDGTEHELAQDLRELKALIALLKGAAGVLQASDLAEAGPGVQQSREVLEKLVPATA